MKKLFLVLAAFILIAANANAQSGFGVKAGLNFNSMSDIKIADLETSVQNKTGFHVGVVYKLKLPAGLALQPELVYTQKSSSISYAGEKSENKMGYLQLPVNLQWGIDLVLFRPFIQVSPYVGYVVHTKTDFFQTDYEKFQYGIGVGAGLEIWKFQLSGRYCWDLGDVGTFSWDKTNPQKIDLGKNRGFELSLAIIF